MKRLSRSTLASLGIIISLGLGIAIFPAQAFNLKDGIVGNLREDCKLNGNCNFCDFISLFVVLERIILALFAGLALVMLVWGGQSVIMSAGSQEKYTAGKKLITSTLLGVLIVLAGFFLINILISLLTNQQGLFGAGSNNKWWNIELGNNISCIETNPTAENFCQAQSDGTKCGDMELQVCSHGQCEYTCAGLNDHTTLPRIYRCVAAPCQAPLPQLSQGWCLNAGEVCCTQATNN